MDFDYLLYGTIQGRRALYVSIKRSNGLFYSAVFIGKKRGRMLMQGVGRDVCSVGGGGGGERGM